jgi:hypothetical protein
LTSTARRVTSRSGGDFIDERFEPGDVSVGDDYRFVEKLARRFRRLIPIIRTAPPTIAIRGLVTS